MTREEFYKLTDILNLEVLGNFMHGGEADELIAMFEEAVEHSNILEQEEPVSDELEKAAKKAYPEDIHKQSIFIHGATYAYTHFKNTQLLDEGLEEAATKYAQDKYLPVQTAQSFKAGAEWQKEKDQKK